MPTPFVIDLSHHNGDVDFGKVRAAGVVGVIHKATQGTGYVDPTYAQRKSAALSAGLLWGAYHFATGASVDAQVSNFLNATKPDGSFVLVMDFEENEGDPTNSVSLAQGKSFLSAVQQNSGQRPVVYTGSYLYNLIGKSPDADLAPYRVWWARYSADPQLHPTWSNYWLWQYTDGHNGPTPHSVDGAGYCDCDHTAAGEAALRADWV